jgi:hypothetical protein
MGFLAVVEIILLSILHDNLSRVTQCVCKEDHHSPPKVKK